MTHGVPEPVVDRVLVVDDYVPVARAIARWLEGEGLRCDVVCSEPDALERTRSRTYDLVFTDIQLPGGSGLDLARKLKAQDPSVQVIIMTGDAEVSSAVEALRADVDDYLVKPLEAATLVHAARRAGEHRRLLLENRMHREQLEARVREQERRLQRLYLSSVHAFITALEARDPHTRGHSDRVVRHALALRQHVGGVSRPSLRIGAQLHDIGKIGIRGGILTKPGALTEEEREEVRRHPVVGAQILSPLLEDQAALDTVRHHHEHWDGNGYPDRLAGEDIPVAARIVAVADAFDAMVSARPYREGCDPEEAVARIEAGAGSQFDPGIVRFARQVLLRESTARP